MKEYIKKFESLNAADDHVIDNPFTSYIVGQGNLVCGEPNKKLKLEGGSIVITNNVTLISFTIHGDTYYAEPGMDWDAWIDSNYNTVGANRTGKYTNFNYYYNIYGGASDLALLSDEITGLVERGEEIISNHVYTTQ